MIYGAEAQQLKIQDNLKDNRKHKDDTEKQDKKERRGPLRMSQPVQ